MTCGMVPCICGTACEHRAVCAAAVVSATRAGNRLLPLDNKVNARHYYCWWQCGNVAMVGDTLREAIRRDGRSATTLARDSGVSKPQITRFLRGERSLTLGAVDRLCVALGLELRYVGRGKKQGG